MRRRGARGQGTVEAALGLLLVTSVLVFGIHFSEVAILSLKVQEAAAAAIWDATALKTSDLTGLTPNFAPRANAIASGMNDANTRYTDFDGRQAAAGPSASMVFTRSIGGATVTCRQDNGTMQLALPPFLNPFNAGQGGMTCSARATFTLTPFPTVFLDNELFREQHTRVNTYPICSTGRAQGNSCPAETFVLLGDWGLSNGSEARNCPPNPPGAPCANTGYYLMIQQMWAAGGGGAPTTGTDLVRWALGPTSGAYFPVPYLDEAAFLMAAIGEDGAQPYQWNNPAGEHQGFGPYTVTPGGRYCDANLQSYRRAAGIGGGGGCGGGGGGGGGGGVARDQCAFGLPCNGNQWPQYQ